MALPFYKFEANGNDFILLRDLDLPNSANLPALVRSLCTRKKSVGADGLLLLKDDAELDFSLDYFNSDGSSGMLCGNGALSALLFVFRHIKGSARYKFRVGGQVYSGFCRVGANGNFTEQIVLQIPQVLEMQKLSDSEYYLHTGAAHKVIFCREPVENLDLLAWAEKYRYGVNGSVGANVNLLYHDGQLCRVRTFEKGVEAETLACGTGAVACALAWIWQGLAQNLETENIFEVPIAYSGGSFGVRARWSGQHFYDIELEGRAREVFYGIYSELDGLAKKS